MEKTKTAATPKTGFFNYDRLVKWALPLAACLVLAVLAVTILPGINRAKQPGGPGSEQMPNPYQDVNSAKDFSKKLGIKLDAPANSTNKAYHIISSAIADVDFDLNGHSYSLRASKSNEDFSGVEGDVIRTEGINFVDGAHLDVIQSGEEQYLRFTWAVNGITYYLSNFDGATISEITSVLGTVTYGK